MSAPSASLQLSDHVAVTWQSVREYNTTNSNNFQIEFFFDGKVRITILAIAATDGLIGLSLVNESHLAIDISS